MIVDELNYSNAISQYFEEEEDIINFLHAKYGNWLIVEEAFEPGDDELPEGAEWYIDYHYPGTEGSPGTHWEPPDPGEPPEHTITYGVTFFNLIQFLRENYEIDGAEIEAFFNTYVKTPEKREKFIQNAKKRNSEEHKNIRYKYHSYSKSYRQL